MHACHQGAHGRTEERRVKLFPDCDPGSLRGQAPLLGLCKDLLEAVPAAFELRFRFAPHIRGRQLPLGFGAPRVIR